MNETATDISAELGPARDQGRRGTCLAFAANAAHEQARLRRRGVPRPELGEELLYWRCKQIDGDGIEGTVPSSVASALLDPGQSGVALWPYDKTRNELAADYAPPAAALDASELRRASLRETEASSEKIRELLAKGQAVVLGIRLWGQFFEDHGGDLLTPSPTDLLPGGHAVTVVGSDEQAGWLLIRNSWGESWGDRGHARLPEAALNDAVTLGAWVVEDDVDD